MELEMGTCIEVGKGKALMKRQTRKINYQHRLMTRELVGSLGTGERGKMINLLRIYTHKLVFTQTQPSLSAWTRRPPN